MRLFVVLVALGLAPALTRGQTSAAAPSVAPISPLMTHPTLAPSPSTIGSSSSNLSLVAKERSSLVSAPTQRPSGLFNSYTCVAIKPYLVCGIVTWKTMNCTEVLDEYEFLAGNCCPLRDYGTKGCRLEVNGPESFCSYKTRYDRKYYSYLIAPTNTGTCLASQYRVELPPTPAPTRQPRASPTTTPTTISPYAKCFQSTYLTCAGTCGGSSTSSSSSSSSSADAFRTSYQRCVGSHAAQSARCVKRASNRCMSKRGRPPTAVCDSLPSVGRTGTLETSTCARLKRRCRSPSGTVVCK